jgi:hypothetical protein
MCWYASWQLQAAQQQLQQQQAEANLQCAGLQLWRDMAQLSKHQVCVMLASGSLHCCSLGFVRLADVVCGRAVFEPQRDLCLYWTVSMVRLVSVCDWTPATQQLPRRTSWRQQVQANLQGAALQLWKDMAQLSQHQGCDLG